MNAGSSSVMGGGGGGGRSGRKWRVPEDDTLQIVDPRRGKGKMQRSDVYPGCRQQIQKNETGSYHRCLNAWNK
ncbi:Hypothetical predicted protein [Octopus vulgaris]|uniref:Uncharacterized protein n=1 Tax=Octopus vulgaris TaxID=6645 RepID=A0AA36F113_OCTVU|nr:Hypothetical predicted protein [Octopus vulgaris]